VTQSVTDENGVVEFSGLPGGRYSVQVVYDECLSPEPSYSPSGLPSGDSTALPSSIPTTASLPSNPPSEEPGLRNQVTDPCVGGPLIGATVRLIGTRNTVVDQATTDSEGYYTFTIPPPGMRYTIQIDYPECGIRELSDFDTNV